MATKSTKPKEIKADNTAEAGEQIAKRKRNTPSDIVGGSSAKKGDVSRIIANCLKWYKLDRVKTLDELSERLELFFTECFTSGEIPTVEKMCLAIGYDRKVVWEWETGQAVSQLGADAGNIVKKAKNFIATFESEMVTEGKINPVVYIFRAKNFFGMKDVQDYVLTPNNPLGGDSDPATMVQKYQKALPSATIDYEMEDK